MALGFQRNIPADKLIAIFKQISRGLETVEPNLQVFFYKEFIQNRNGTALDASFKDKAFVVDSRPGSLSLTILTPERLSINIHDIQVFVSNALELIQEEERFRVLLHQDSTKEIRLLFEKLEKSHDRLELKEFLDEEFIPFLDETLFEVNEEQQAEKSELDHDLKWLQPILEAPFLTPEKWALLVKLLGYPKENRTGYLPTAMVQYRGQPPEKFLGVQTKEGLASIVAIRKMLNKWRELILTEKNPELSRFRAVNRLNQNSIASFLMVTETEMIESGDDFVVADLQLLLEKIEAYFKEPPKDTYVAIALAEDGDGASDVTEKVVKKVKDDNELLEKFANAGVQYREESLRMREILIPQFFRLNGFDYDLVQQLRLSYPSQFADIEREFSNELERALRSLSLDEIKELAGIKGRAKLLRLLYGRLANNPRFITVVQVVKQKYIEMAPPDSAQKIDAASNFDADDVRVDQRFSAVQSGFEARLTSDEASYLSESQVWERSTKNLTLLVTEIDLPHATQADFLTIFERFGISQATQTQLLSGLDLAVFLRFSPERILYLDQQQFELLFGELKNFPSIFQESSERQKFLSILSEYLEMRRKRLDDAYKTYDISQSQDSDKSNTLGFNSEEVERILLAKSQLSAAQRANPNISAKHFVVAASLNPEEVRSLEAEGHQESQEISTAYQELLAERAKAYARLLISQTALEERARKKALQQGGLIGYSDKQNGELTQRQLDAISTYLEKENVDGEQYSYYSAEAGMPYDEVQKHRARRGISFSPLKKALDSKKNIGRQLADKAASGIGTAALAGTGIGAAAPEPVKKLVGYGIAGGVGALIGSAIMALINGALSIATFAVGATLGAVVGGVLGSFIGLTIPGAILGGGLGGAIGSFAGSILKNAGFDLFSSSTATGTAATPTAATFTATPTNGIINFLANPVNYVVPVVVSVTAATAAIYQTAFNSAFLPPPLGTVGDDGNESKYVKIEKIPEPRVAGMKFSQPQNLKYSIRITPKTGYSLKITGISDSYTVIGNNEARAKAGLSEAVPTPAAPPISMSSLPKTELGPNEEIVLPVYETVFDQSYQHTNVTNTVTLNFTTTESDGTAVETTAKTAEVACFGECPQSIGGCWPADGFLFQLPYDEPKFINSHAPGSISAEGADAFDITVNGSNGFVGEPVVAPFAGKACMTQYVPENTWEAGIPSYGILVTLQPTGKPVTLYFGHLMSTTIPASCKNVSVGEQIGKLGNSGYSSGPHLHYEVKPGGGKGNSFLKSLVPDGKNIKGPGLAVRSTCRKQ